MIELGERFENEVKHAVEEILGFKTEFVEYRQQKDGEVVELGRTYGKRIEDTVERVDKFQEMISLNVGGMLKDIEDIKLQITAAAGTKRPSSYEIAASLGGGGGNLSLIERDLANLKERMELL